MNALQTIQTKIKNHGPLSFVEFMQFALYDSKFGYYTSGLEKIGKSGDFITAPQLTPLFAHALANECQPILSSVLNPSVLEFGAGTGRLCIDLLKQLEQLHQLPEHYYILEVSGDLQQRQYELIKAEIPHLLPRIQWLSSWPNFSLNGVVLGNEVLDAMPVHRFLKKNNQFYESFVELGQDEELIQTFKLCTNSLLLTYLQTQLSNLNEPYQSEINLFLQPWLNQCSQLLNHGALFLFDYGFPHHEYYHPDRHSGTLMCHFRHQAHTNPFINIGEQDITAHVDFTHVAECAYDAGFEISGYTNQAAFLLSNGILDSLNKISDPLAKIKAQQAVKILTLPNEMGELFKVIALTKQLSTPLNGFQILDKRASL